MATQEDRDKGTGMWYGLREPNLTQSISKSDMEVICLILPKAPFDCSTMFSQETLGAENGAMNTLKGVLSVWVWILETDGMVIPRCLSCFSLKPRHTLVFQVEASTHISEAKGGLEIKELAVRRK